MSTVNDTLAAVVREAYVEGYILAVEHAIGALKRVGAFHGHAAEMIDALRSVGPTIMAEAAIKKAKVPQ